MEALQTVPSELRSTVIARFISQCRLPGVPGSSVSSGGPPWAWAEPVSRQRAPVPITPGHRIMKARYRGYSGGEPRGDSLQS